MADLTVVEKVFTGGKVLGCPLPPHSNIALTETQGRYAAPQNPMNITTARKLENFGEYLETVVNEETVQIILLQIAHAVHHIHEQEWSHGEIKKENLRISESKKKVVLLQQSKKYSKKKFASKQEKRKDIKDLGDLFCEILKKKNINDEVSASLLEYMNKDGFTSEKVLQHPYFWSTAKKLRFLATVAQCSKDKTKVGDKAKPSRRAIMLKSLLDKSSSETFTLGWIDELAVKESRRGKKSQRSVGKSEIIQLAEDTTHAKYDKDSLCSLVNFIRNHWEHFWEQSDSVKRCFKSDPIEGYWQFFNTRFPKLFINVYEVVKYMLTTQHSNKQMENVYYKPLTLNQDLRVN